MWNCILRDSCQVPALRGDCGGTTELRREGWGLGGCGGLIRRPSTGEAHAAHLAPENCKEVFESLATTKVHVGWKDPPGNSRRDSWRVHKASSEFYQLEWRNSTPHRALDWVLSHLSKHQADLQVTAHQNKIQYSLKEFNKNPALCNIKFTKSGIQLKSKRSRKIWRITEKNKSVETGLRMTEMGD